MVDGREKVFDGYLKRLIGFQGAELDRLHEPRVNWHGRIRNQVREHVCRREIVKREAGIAMEWWEEKRPVGGAVLCCRIDKGRLEARGSIARGGEELGDRGGGIVGSRRPEIEKTFELSQDLCSAGGDCGGKKIVQEGLYFVREDGGG